MKVEIDRDRCAGHGMCYMVAPTVFHDDDDGYGQVIGDGEVSGEQAEQARYGAGNCPEQAVLLTEDAANGG
jgi:ferredoxin